MASFRETRLWRYSLGSTDFRGSRENWRKRLEVAFEGMRRQAIPLSREITRDLPEFTVHDETHIDALWETAEIIGGAALSLNPVEAFLFGGAAICHDLAMSIASYPGGRNEVRRLPLYNQGAALLYPNCAVEDLTDKERDRVDAWALRENHAVQAERLAQQKWVNPKDSSEHTLIEDAQFRLFFGHRIGKFAESHWWPLDKVSKELSGCPGPPGGIPAEWIVDEFKIAALLRAADAAHIDHRRAPSFLFTLRHLAGLSADHWLFQNLLETPRVGANRLKYSASRPFKVDEAEAWWLCYDTINMINAELAGIDRYFEDHHASCRFDARSVLGAHDPEELERAVHVESWIPVDARPTISNVASLIDRLGGTQLYGTLDFVPLRELLQNALDATDALRCDSPELDSIALVACTLTTGPDGSIELTIRDNGIGMTRATLIGALLDFGSSLWRSELLRREFPRLLERRFKSIGKFGIGFFSVFMWADEVTILTRVHNARRDETLALEFRNGLRDRAILRLAGTDERRDVGGTTVTLRLRSDKMLRTRNKYSARSERPALWNLINRILPLPAVTVNVNADGKESAILPMDWRSARADELIRRISGGTRVDKTWARHVLSEITDDGALVGRAAFYAGYLSEDLEATVIGPGGFRVGSVKGCVGIFCGDALNVARDKAVVFASGTALRRWASDQARKLTPLLTPEQQLDIAESVSSIGGEVGQLAVGRTAAGILNLVQVAEWARNRDHVLVADGGLFDDREGDPMVLRDDVIWLDYRSEKFRQSLGWSRDREEQELPSRNTLLGVVSAAVIERWQADGFANAGSRNENVHSYVTVAHYEASGVPAEETPAAILVRDSSVVIPADA